MQHALFMFDMYYPSGGVDDLVMVGTLDECIQRAEAQKEFDIVQIAELPSLKVVRTGRWEREPPTFSGPWKLIWA